MLTLAIQAGGQSRRMGRDKGLIELGGVPLIEHLLRRVGGLADEVLITTNNPVGYAYLGLRLAGDDQPGAGALHGLLTALRAARGDLVLILACDMPFVSRRLIEHLLALTPEADVVVPRWDDRFQPLHAVYRRATCLPAVEAALARDERRVISFYEGLQVVTVDEETVARLNPGGRSFFNINTPEDLAEAERLLDAGT
ncbi:MAG: molybdenum cofactor guanylyltransferase [Anaerolineae bacterium]